MNCAFSSLVSLTLEHVSLLQTAIWNKPYSIESAQADQLAHTFGIC